MSERLNEREKDAICPHCNEKRTSGRIAQHMASCPKNPSVRLAIAAALADPEHPGVARPRSQYAALYVLYGASSHTVLTNYYGSWAGVCAEFGLQTEKKPERAPADCPYCEQSAGGKHLAKHMQRCPRNPDLRATIVAALAEPDAPGCAVNQVQYAQSARKNSAPSVKRLIAVFGSWDAACSYFDLLSVSPEAIEERAIAETDQDQERAQKILEQERIGERPLYALDWHYQDGKRVPGGRPLPDGRYAHVLR